MRTRDANIEKESNEFKKFANWSILFFIVWVIPFAALLYLCEKDEIIEQLFPAIGVLFSGLAFIGLIITVIYQRQDIMIQKEEVAKSFELEKELSVVDLYKEYKSTYLQDITKSSWRILTNCLKSKEYADYYLRTYFCIDYQNEKFTDVIMESIKFSYPEDLQKSSIKLRDAESDERYKLDALLNFFHILSFRLDAKYISHCEFYYDWWRPLFWWLSDMREIRYKNIDNPNKKYCIAPNLSFTLKKLDKIYGFHSPSTPLERWRELIQHPMLQSINIDKRIIEYYE